MKRASKSRKAEAVGRSLRPVVRRCIGYGPHEGKCENEAGTPWGPHWCMRCDKIRLATISKNLTDMVNAFPSNGQVERPIEPQKGC